MNNMYGKDKFHDRQKAVLQKSAQKIENDSGWAQNNFMREYSNNLHWKRLGDTKKSRIIRVAQ